MIAALLLLLATPAAAPLVERDLTWDVNLEGGYGRDPVGALWLGRVRGGAMLVRGSLYAFAGATWEPTNRSASIFGLQGEVLHLESGLWAQLGANLDASGPHPGVVVAAGFSVVGVELQQHAVGSGPPGFSLLAKLRLPLGVIARALGILRL